jgi:hypothetical protein
MCQKVRAKSLYNIKSEEKWYLNGESIEICNEFMYLGILLNYNGVFTNTQKMLSNQGKKAGTYIYNINHILKFMNIFTEQNSIISIH